MVPVSAPLGINCMQAPALPSPGPCQLRSPQPLPSNTAAWQHSRPQARARSLSSSSTASQPTGAGAAAAGRGMKELGSCGTTCSRAASGLNSGVSAKTRKRLAMRLRRPRSASGLRPRLSRSASRSICMAGLDRSQTSLCRAACCTIANLTHARRLVA